MTPHAVVQVIDDRIMDSESNETRALVVILRAHGSQAQARSR
jgi:hypothetical protein